MTDAQTKDLLERRFRVIGRHSPLFYQEPLHLVRGEGVWVYDADGHRYLDVYNNVPCVGHCHPHVVKAISEQAATLNTHTRYLHQNIVEYAEGQRDRPAHGAPAHRRPGHHRHRFRLSR
jgi:4-aminobutyrate aminotransferase-like enzyme